MQDFIRLDSLPLFPQQCAACGSQKAGAWIDTRRDLPGDDWRVYLCDSCVRRGALLLGMIAGDQQDKLLDADRLLTLADQRVADLEHAIADVGRQRLDETKRADRLQTLLDEALDRERTRQHQLEELTRQAAELVA